MRLFRAWLALTTASLLIAATASVRADETLSAAAYEEAEDQMALLVDRARVANGLLPLARAQSLDRAAGAHARDMAAQGYMEHTGLNGSVPASRAADAGYHTPRGSAWLVVEVISARGDPPDPALNYWLSDGLHRRVVLRSYWREMGIGFAQGGPYGRFWVALFGCRPNVLPAILLDGTLTISDENCGSAPDAFGRVEAVRTADTPMRVNEAEWQPYLAQQDWPQDRPAHVQLRDGTGRVLDVKAADPTATVTELP